MEAGINKGMASECRMGPYQGTQTHGCELMKSRACRYLLAGYLTAFIYLFFWIQPVAPVALGQVKWVSIAHKSALAEGFGKGKKNQTVPTLTPPATQPLRLANTDPPVSHASDSLWLHLLPSFPAYAQHQQPKFKRLTPNQGLSHGHVTAILKDHQGFMWFATDEGLNKYDGYRFTAFKHDQGNANSIGNNFVREIMEDQAGNVWVGTSSGLDKLNRKQETFSHYNPVGRNIYIEDIFQDSRKRMWIGANDGLYLFDTEKSTFKHYQHHPKDTNSLSHNSINQIQEDQQGDMWIGTQQGLSRFNPQTHRFIRYEHDPNNRTSIGSNWITTFYKDRKGNLWIGTLGGGIALFNRKENNFTNFLHDPTKPNSLAHNDVLSLVESNDGKLWVGTENGGMSVFDPEKNTFVTYQYDATDNTSLSNNSVHSLYKDDIGNIWAGTWSGGVNFLSRFGDKFAHYKHLPNNKHSLSNNIVTTIMGDSDGNIWMGTDGGGLNLLDRQKKTIIQYRNDLYDTNSIKSDYIISATEVSKDILALGYHRVGFDFLNRKTGVITHLPEGNPALPLSNTSVTVVHKDLWLGTYYSFGLFYYDRATKQFTRYQHNPLDTNSINEGQIFSLLEDKEGNVWVGMGLNSGLDFLDRATNRFIHYQHDPNNKYSISNNIVFSIIENKRGDLWVGTDNGLNYFDKQTKRFTAYTEKDGLPNNVIYGMLEDRHGNVWLSSNKGLAKFNPVTKTCRNYDVSDGLQDNTFKPNAWYQTAQGEMFFGGVNGFNVFHPDSVRDNPFIPPVRITGLQIFNKPVAIGKDSVLHEHIGQTNEITLSYQQSVFTLEFAALNYTSPEKNQYAYQLEGFDKGWNYIGTRRTATYTNLNADTYIFRVKASNNDGVWNEQGASLIIHILPPWWKTWWFRITVSLILSGIAIAYYWLRIRTIKRRNKKLEKLVVEKTQQLQSANEELVVREEEITAQNEELSSRNEELVQRQEEIASQRDLLADQNQRLNKARKTIEKHNQILDQEVKERTKELVAHNQQLEQFAFITAHNLRGPVARILGLGQILELSKNNPDEEKMIVDKLIYTTEELDRVVNDVNTILAIQKNNTLSITEINLTEELNLIKALLANEITLTQTKIREDFSQDNIIHTVKPYLDSILLNLISNAIKYRQPSQTPCIDIKTEIQGGYVCLLIKDNGLGIDLLHHQKNLFNLYKRFHSHVEGKGMGLYLVKTQVVALGGKIEVESQVNLGTTFKVFLKNDVNAIA